MTQIALIADEVSSPLWRGIPRGARDEPTGSLFGLLPRASRRSYRERVRALTEIAETFLPRACLGSYRERRDALGMFVFARSGRLIQRRLCRRLLHGLSYLGVGNLPGLTHEITIVRGQGREGVYAEDRSIRVLV